MSETPTQTTNDITAVRTALFETLRGLSNQDNPMDIERAKAVNEVAQTIINSAKVEIDALRVFGGSGTGFIPALLPPPPKPKTPLQPSITHPKPGVTQHILK